MELTNLAISTVMFCAPLPCSPLWYLLARQSLIHLSSLLSHLVLLLGPDTALLLGAIVQGSAEGT